MTRIMAFMTTLFIATGAGCSAYEGGAIPDAIDSQSDAEQDGVPEAPVDGEVETAYEIPEVPEPVEGPDCYQDIDIVFVLDVSTSMSWVLAALRDEIGAVWEYAVAMSDHADYDPMFGLVVFVDDVLVTNGGGPYASAADMQSQFESWRAFCSTEAQPGGNPCRNMDCPENTLDALAAAAQNYRWREGALHIAIHVTDDTFREAPGMLCSLLSPSIPVQHTYAEVISLLVEKEIRVGVFAVRSSTCPVPADKSPGFFAPWNGQDPIPTATGSRVWDLHDVQSGAISLTEAVQGFVLEEWCTDYII
jgi:hypothetical protein